MNGKRQPTPPHPKGRGRGLTTTHAKVVRSRQNEVREIELRIAGLTYPKIAEELGVVEGAARNYVVNVLERYKDELKELVSEMVVIESQRIEEFVAVLGPTAMGEDGKIFGQQMQDVDKLVKLSKQRRSLLGLDAPYGMTVEQGLTPEVLQARTEERWVAVLPKLAGVLTDQYLREEQGIDERLYQFREQNVVECQFKDVTPEEEPEPEPVVEPEKAVNPFGFDRVSQSEHKKNFRSQRLRKSGWKLRSSTGKVGPRRWCRTRRMGSSSCR